MKVIGMKEARLAECIKQAHRDRVVITRNGKPVALIIGVEGKDLEQVELGSSDRFWQFIRERRKGKTISQAELEKRLAKG